MKKLLVIFEGGRPERFEPLNLLRPTFMLRCGMVELWVDIKRRFPGYDLAFETVPQFEYLVRRQTALPVNRFDWREYDRIVLFNGAGRPDEQLIEYIEACDLDTAFYAGDAPLALVLDGQGDALKDYLQIEHDLDKYLAFARSLKNQSEYSGRAYQYIWDIGLNGPDALRRDFPRALADLQGGGALNQVHAVRGCELVEENDIFIHAEADIAPGSVFDAGDGPIFIDSGVRVDPGSYILGPFYAGVNSRILGGRLAGSSLGPVCQVAGELEECILQGYVNKHHAGFLGHSVIGEWVNFGALTTNSDLKNNYSTVRVYSHGEPRDTGATKVGSFIGDHTKFGIGALLNTGIHIGAFCNIFGGTLVTDKFVPSFSWGSSGAWQEYDIEKALETAQRAMARRERALSDEDITAIRLLKDLKH